MTRYYLLILALVLDPVNNIDQTYFNYPSNPSFYLTLNYCFQILAQGH